MNTYRIFKKRIISLVLIWTTGIIWIIVLIGIFLIIYTIFEDVISRLWSFYIFVSIAIVI